MWIGGGFSPKMKLSRDNLIRWQKEVVENVERSLEYERDERIVGCMAVNAVPN